MFQVSVKKYLFIASTVLSVLFFAFAFHSDIALTKEKGGFGEALAPALTATKTAALDTSAGGDLNGNGLINPGDRLTYTITIPNAGPDAALGVNLTDTIDANTTLLNGSVIASPIAVNDTYSSIGNVGINVLDGAGDLLSNDLDANNPGVNTALVITQINNAAFVSGTAVPTTNGSVTVNSNGSFSYNPNAGFTGTDTFTYTLSNNTGLTDTSTVSITMTGKIWFVNNASGACSANCNGRLSNPFTTLAAFQTINNGAANNPNDGDSIFVYSGSGNYTGGVVLRNNQKLIGQGALETILAITGYAAPSGTNQLPNTNGTRPVIVNTTGNAIAIANDNDIRGLTVNAANNAAIAGSGKGGTTAISNIGINASTTGGGLSLNNQTGTLTISNSTIASNSSGTAVLMSGNAANNANVTFSNTPISQTGGRVIDIQTKTGGTVAFSGTSTVTGTNGTTDAIVLRNNTGGTTITFSNTVNITTTSAGARALQTDNSTGSFTLNMNAAGNTLSSTGGAAMDVEDVAANLTFTSISSTNSTAQGVRIFNITGSVTSPVTTPNNPATFGIYVESSSAAFNFGNVNATSSGDTGIRLLSNSGAITFADLDIAPDAAKRGLQATDNSGTITISSGTISTTSNVAVEITRASSTTPLNVQLTNVSANGGTNGIVLTNTSTSGSPGGFTIIGDGASNTANTTRGRITAKLGGGTITPGSGGTIQSTTGSAISLSNTALVVLRNMVVQNGGGDGIAATSVSGLTVDNTQITGKATGNGFRSISGSALTVTHSEFTSNATSSSLAGSFTANFGLDNQTGTATIDSSLFQTAYAFVFYMGNTSGTFSLNLNNSTVSGATNGIGFDLIAGGNSNLTANLQSSTFSGHSARGIQASTTTASAGTLTFTVNNSQFINNFVSVDNAHGSSGTYTYNVTNNNFQTNVTSSAMAINVNRLGSPSFSNFGLFTGTISGNVIGTAGTANSGSSAGDGIKVESNGSGGISRVAITNNTIREVGQYGIDVAIVDTVIGGGVRPTLEARVAGNSVSNMKASALDAVFVLPGTLGTDSPIMCLDIANNNATGIRNGLRVRPSAPLNPPQPTPTINLEGWDGVTAVTTYFANRPNTFVGQSGTNIFATAGSGGTFQAVASCNTPSSPAPTDLELAELTGFDSGNLNFSASNYFESAHLFSALKKQNLIANKHFNELNTSEDQTTLNLSNYSGFSESINLKAQNEGTNNYHGNSIWLKLWNAFPEMYSLIVPTVSAQESKKTTAETKSNQFAPESGETINKSLGIIPAGETVTVQFKATIDANLPANDFSVSNTAQISASNHANINSTTATTTVIQPPTISKAFGASSISFGSTTSLTFTIGNPNPSTNLTNISFTDTLPAGLVVANPNGLVNNCLGGTVTAVADSNSIVVSALSRNAAAANCTIVVNVRATAVGVQNNLTEAIKSNESNDGGTAAATLTVTNPVISGTVTYGVNPSNLAQKFVAGVLLTAAGTLPAVDSTDTTDSMGIYSLENLTPNGGYIVTASKTGDSNGISPFDATLILRHVAANGQGANALTGNQLIAADTNADNSITPFDATLILRFIASGGSNANTGEVGNWRFVPNQKPYPSVTNSLAGEDYQAILVGEINGSWVAP